MFSPRLRQARTINIITQEKATSPPSPSSPVAARHLADAKRPDNEGGIGGDADEQSSMKHVKRLADAVHAVRDDTPEGLEKLPAIAAALHVVGDESEDDHNRAASPE